MISTITNTSSAEDPSTFANANVFYGTTMAPDANLQLDPTSGTTLDAFDTNVLAMLRQDFHQKEIQQQELHPEESRQQEQLDSKALFIDPADLDELSQLAADPENQRTLHRALDFPQLQEPAAGNSATGTMAQQVIEHYPYDPSLIALPQQHQEWSAGYVGNHPYMLFQPMLQPEGQSAGYFHQPGGFSPDAAPFGDQSYGYVQQEQQFYIPNAGMNESHLLSVPQTEVYSALPSAPSMSSNASNTTSSSGGKKKFRHLALSGDLYPFTLFFQAHLKPLYSSSNSSGTCTELFEILDQRIDQKEWLTLKEYLESIIFLPGCEIFTRSPGDTKESQEDFSNELAAMGNNHQWPLEIGSIIAKVGYFDPDDPHANVKSLTTNERLYTLLKFGHYRAREDAGKRKGFSKVGGITYGTRKDGRSDKAQKLALAKAKKQLAAATKKAATAERRRATAMANAEKNKLTAMEKSQKQITKRQSKTSSTSRVQAAPATFPDQNVTNSMDFDNGLDVNGNLDPDAFVDLGDIGDPSADDVFSNQQVMTGEQQSTLPPWDQTYGLGSLCDWGSYCHCFASGTIVITGFLNPQGQVMQYARLNKDTSITTFDPPLLLANAKWW